jgi:hypothetical protein
VGIDPDGRPEPVIVPSPDRLGRGRRAPPEAELSRLRSRLTARKWDADVAALKLSEADPANRVE